MFVLRNTYKKVFLKYQSDARCPSLLQYKAYRNEFLIYFTQKKKKNRKKTAITWEKMTMLDKNLSLLRGLL